jgi:hypothetical protein
MTAGELKKQLALFADHCEVVISCDAEGNDFKPIDEIGLCRYQESTGKISPANSRVGKPAIVLYPAN